MNNIKKLVFIDIVYYNCFTFYRRYEKDLNEFSAQALTSVCLSLNLLTFIIIFERIFNFSLFENKWNTLFLSLPMLLFVIFRYNKYISISEIEDQIFEKSKNQINRLNIISFLYVIVSIFGTIILAIIYGEINNPPPFWENWLN
jgi:hypothetical protein